MCSDRFSYALDLAIFDVEKYLDHEKGEHGDEKATSIFFILNKPVLYQDESITEKAKTLQRWNRYYVNYDHIYINDGKSLSKELKKLIKQCFLSFFIFVFIS
jgi:hypothetical protein